MRGKEVNFGKLLHGGDYNPEQWLDYPEILEQDLDVYKRQSITMPMLVANLLGGYTVDYGVLMLGVFICTIPTCTLLFRGMLSETVKTPIVW